MAEEQAPEQTPVSTEPVAADPQVQQEDKAPETLEEKFARLEKELADRNAAYEKDRARFDKRLAHVVSKKNSYRDEVFALREAALKQQAPGREPTAADFGNDPVKFIEGRDAYKQRTTAHQQEMQRLQSEREQAIVSESQAMLVEQIENEFGGDTAAIEQIRNAQAPTSPDMLRFMANVPEGARMVRHFAQYPQDAAAICNAPDQQTRHAMLMQVVGFVRNGSNAAAPAPQAAPVAAPKVNIPAPPPVAGGRTKPSTAESSSMAYYRQLQNEREQRNKPAQNKR